MATRGKRMISLAIDNDLFDQIEAWLAAQSVRPSKTAVVETALREFFAKRKPRK